MPESANRAAGTVYSVTTPFTPEEYIKTLLETGTPVEVIEKFINDKITELNKSIKDLRDNNADEEEITNAEKDLKKYKKISKTVKKQAELAQKDQELKESIAKTQKCYEDTLVCADKILEFISELDIENLGNVNAKKAQLHTLIDGDGKGEIGFKNLLNSQIGIKNETLKILEAIKNLKVDYDVYEEYRKLVPVFAGKTREVVKAKYKETLEKIQELEQKRDNCPYLHDKNIYRDLIVELKRINDEVLPTLLENPNEMEAIKEEVAKELNIPYTPPANPTDPKKESPVGGDDGGSSGNDDLDKGGAGKNPKNPEKGKPVPPVTGPEDDTFKKAKQEYLGVIESINEAIKFLNAINQEQDAYAANPEFNYERMIEKEKEATKICNRITDFKNILLDLEYNNYVNNHIMLNLDPEVQAAKIDDADYNGELETFVSLHNEVIEGCYKELHQIAGQEDYVTREDLKERAKLLMKVIDTQHLIINRRLLSERRKDKNFDMIAFMKSHRVDSKKFDKEPIEKIEKSGEKPISPKPEKVEPSEKKQEFDEKPIIAIVEKEILIYKKAIEAALSAKYILDIRPQDAKHRRTEQEAIDKKISKADEAITKFIAESQLSNETKQKMHQKAADMKAIEYKEYEEQIAADKAYYELRVSYVKDVDQLIALSEELIKMSETTISSDEYKNKKAKLHETAMGLKEKYKELDIQLSKDEITERIVVSIHEKYSIDITKDRLYTVLRVMSAEKEKSLKPSNMQIKKDKLDFGGKTQRTSREQALIETTDSVKISLLKNSIKVEYTKKMLEDLKKLKVKLEVAASANSEGSISVTEGKDSKDGKKEMRYIKNPEEISKAQILYRDMETGEEIMSYDIFENSEITQAIEERSGLKK